MKKGWHPRKIGPFEYKDLGMYFELAMDRFRCIDTDDKGDLKDVPTKDSIYYYNLPRKYLPEWVFDPERLKRIAEIGKNAPSNN